MLNPPGITRGELTVSGSKLAEISRNSRSLYWWEWIILFSCFLSSHILQKENLSHKLQRVNGWIVHY